MERDKAIQILSDCADRGLTTFNADFKDAVRMGRDALIAEVKTLAAAAAAEAAAKRAGINSRLPEYAKSCGKFRCCDTPSCIHHPGDVKCRVCGAECPAPF